METEENWVFCGIVTWKVHLEGSEVVVSSVYGGEGRLQLIKKLIS